MKKTFSAITGIMLAVLMLFASCEQGGVSKAQIDSRDLVAVSFAKVEAKSVNVDGIGTVQTPELENLYFQYKAVKNSADSSGVTIGAKESWTDLGGQGLGTAIQLSRGKWDISLRGFASDDLRTAAGTTETASTQAIFEGSITTDVGSNLASRTENVNVSLDFTNPSGTGSYSLAVSIPASYASQQAKVKVTVTPASGEAQVQTFPFTAETTAHTYSFSTVNNGIASVKVEYLDASDVAIGKAVTANTLIMTDMTTNGSATVSEDNTFTVSFEGTSVNGTAEGKYAPTTFTSLFEIYPDTIADNEIVVGYAYETKALDATPISFPAEILTGDAVKDESGRYKASELGLVPVTVTTSSDLNASGATEAWWGKKAAVGISPTDNTTLASVQFVDGVTSIGYQAFNKCTNLTSITIPASVTSIGQSAFYMCTSLTGITIPSSVTRIESSAFSACSGLTSITIPEGVTTIKSSAFSHCTGLTSITIPEGVTEIESQAFWGCSGLADITIPASVTEIGGQAFSGCTNLTEVTYGGTIEQWYAIKYAMPSIADVTCSDTKAVFMLQKTTSGSTVGVSVKGLTPYGKNCTEIAIPEGVTRIGSEAFKGCTNLTSIMIPAGVTTIESYAFCRCTGLTSINIPASVTSIGSSAFQNCTGLTSVTIPDGVMSIEGNAFSGCTSLTSITIPESVTSIKDYAFNGCTGLTSINIPASVTSIGSYAFYNCTSLTNIYVNQQESTLLADARVPEGCEIHWNSTGPESV